MHCDLRDELGKNYLLAAVQAEDARRELGWAFTPTLAAIAATRLERLEGYHTAVLRELVSHCTVHGCATREIARLLGGLLPNPSDKKAAA